MRVEDFLSASAKRDPDKVALVVGEVRMSYAELDRRSDCLARALRAHGIERGDRILLLLDNCIEAVVTIFAALKAGAIFSPVSPSTKAPKLATLIESCRPAAIVALGRLLPVVREAVGKSGHVALTVLVGESPGGTRSDGVITFDGMVARSQPTPLASGGVDHDVAVIIFTSGSTGRPKGVVMAHHNVVAATSSISAYLGNSADDVILNVLPLSHNYGLYQLFTAIQVGATLVLEKSFAFPAAVLDRAEKCNATALPLVPTMVSMLLQMKALSPGRIQSLRYLTNAAAPLPVSHVQRLQELFPHAKLFCMYGLTECVRGTFLPPEEVASRAGSVGIAIPGTEAWIVDENGGKVGRGEVGELVIRGPHVMRGYWEDRVETDKVLRPGAEPWDKVLHTGDLFRADVDGYLYFVARKDDMIKSRGEKISPQEVEGILYALPGVREAVVVSDAHPVFGAVLRAIIVAHAGVDLTKRDVLRHCATHLEDVMVPAEIEFRDELPKTESGKLLRRAIQSNYREAAE